MDYPKLVTFNMVTDDKGGTTPVPINPWLVFSVLAISIPGTMLLSSGEPVMKSAAGLETLVGKIIPVDHTPEEAQAILEGKGSDV